MFLSLRLAWRNIWRNRGRSIVTLTAIALNTAILILSYALTGGMLEQMTKTATDLVVGEAQLHRQGYLADRTLYARLDEVDRILDAARAAGIPAAPRAYGFGLVAAGSKSAGASFWGVDPDAERRAFDLAGKVVEGAYLGGGEDPAQSVVLGRRLAKTLGAKVGDEIVALVQAADGSTGNELLRVHGILAAVGEEMDRSAVIMRRDDFATLFATDAVHEIAFNSRGKVTTDQLRRTVAAPAGSELQTWRELLPTLSDMLNLTDSSLWIIAFVFGLAAGLGVLNTMLMATHDRVREYGVLKALGAGPGRVLADVTIEALLMSLLGTGIGISLALLGHAYLGTHGLNFGYEGAPELSVGGLAYSTVMYSRLTLDHVWTAALTMWILCVVASLYPAIKAARLEPVAAMTHV